MPFYVQKPQVFPIVQWTGDNLAEIQTFCEQYAPWALPLELGTEELEGYLVPMWNSGIQPIAVGDYMGQYANLGPNALESLQEVPSIDMVYTVETE